MQVLIYLCMNTHEYLHLDHDSKWIPVAHSDTYIHINYVPVNNNPYNFFINSESVIIDLYFTEALRL